MDKKELMIQACLQCSYCSACYMSVEPRGVAIQDARREGWRIGLDSNACPLCHIAEEQCRRSIAPSGDINGGKYE